MANWTGLAGAAGLAAALEEIQGRRVREGELQRKLTEGQGEWTPATGGMGGPLGFFDALFGYNKPGQIGFGGQRYQFQPHPRMTEEDVRGMGLTMPQTTTTPAYEKPLPPDVQGPLELVPEQTTTREMPLPGFVGARLDPKTRQALALERFKEHRDLARLKEEYRLASGGGTTGVAPIQPTATIPFKIPGTTDAAPPSGAPPTSATTAAPTSPSVPVPGVDKLSPQFRGKSQAMASRLGFNLDDFYRVVSFETGGEFSPATKNRMQSGATGLIQFTDKTAKGLGTTTEALAKMTPEQQLDYVEKYLAPYKGKLGTLKDLYIAVHYPDALGKPDETVLYTAKDKNPKPYLQNAGLDTGKKGYVTVGDAFAAVQRHAGLVPSTATAQTPATATAQVPAIAAGGTGMQVAGGTAAPAPPITQPAPTTPPTGQQVGATGATGTAAVPTTGATTAPAPPAAPGAEYTPGKEVVALAADQERQLAENDRRIDELEVKRRMAQVGAMRGHPGKADELRSYQQQQDSLREQNEKIRAGAQKAYADDYAKWRDKQATRETEERKAPLAGDVKASEMNVTTDPELRNLTRDLADKGTVGNADFNKLSEPDKAIVIRTAKKYTDNKALVENLDGFSKAALSQILKEDNTPMGEVSTEQLARARAQGAERVKQQKFDEVEAKRLAELKAPMGEFAMKFFNPKTLERAKASMSVPEAEEQGYRLMPVEQQKTLMTAQTSMDSINRTYTLLFGGKDPDGSITGTVGEEFAGIYPTLEKGRTDTQSVIARTKMNWQLKKGIFAGTDIGQSASALDKYIQGTLGALSRDLGGERGHFTDFDARRIQGLFQELKTGLFQVGAMTSSGEAKKLMRQITATISDRVLVSGTLRRDDPLPWDPSGKRREEPQAGGAATGGTTAPPVQAPRTPGVQPTPPAQKTAPATGTAQERVPTPPAAQETAPAPAAPTSQRPNAPAAAQPEQRLQQLTTQYPPAQYGGKKITDPVTGIRYRSDGTAWREVQ